MESVLHEMKKAQVSREIVFMALAIVTALIGVTAAIFINGSKLAVAELILFPLFLALLFCRFRASNCANAICIALYIENTNIKLAHDILKLSDCIRNADALIGMLTKLKSNTFTNP